MKKRLDRLMNMKCPHCKGELRVMQKLTIISIPLKNRELIVESSNVEESTLECQDCGADSEHSDELDTILDDLLS